MKKVLFILCICVIPLWAQENTYETTSEVKQLTEFHDVIYQIWHTGWPGKDIELLSSLMPDVKKGYASIKSAELPGILRDKKLRWDEAVHSFGLCVNTYVTAAENRDSTGLLNAAEQLHSQFERMVRVIKPASKEVDAFHKILYSLYHYYLPNYEFVKIKESAEAMSSCIKDLKNAKFPSRLQTRQEKFDAGKKELESAVENLIETVNRGNNKDAVVSSVESVHSKYQEFEKIFD